MILKGSSKSAPDIPIPPENFLKEDGSGRLLGSIERLKLLAEDILGGKIVFVTEEGVINFKIVNGRYEVSGVQSEFQGLKNTDFQILDPSASAEAAVDMSGASINSDILAPVLVAARQYWLDAGAQPRGLDGVGVELTDLPASPDKPSATPFLSTLRAPVGAGTSTQRRGTTPNSSPAIKPVSGKPKPTRQRPANWTCSPF